MDIPGLYNLFIQYPRIVTDSRQDLKDSIFFGLRGERFNGNLHAAEALKKGACYAVVDEPEVVVSEEYILVEDSLKTLQQLAAYHREKLSIPIIAITGSNGKTTTKELSDEILSSRFSVRSTPGNLNNHIGVPLTLLMMDSSVDVGIVEMGANHPGEISFLCGIAKPDYGLITNVGEAHLEGFGSIEGVKKTKAELYDFIGESGGLIFCNSGDPDLCEMAARIEAGISWYGQGKETVCSAEILSSDPVLSLRLSFQAEGEYDVTTGLVGSYNRENILAAAAIGLHFRIPQSEIVSSLQGWSADNNRSQRLETENNILIMDAYNANPTSMVAALDNFSLQKHPRKVLILGDMLELGEGETRAHQKILDHISRMDCEEVFLVGPVFSGFPLPGEVKAFATTNDFEIWLKSNPLKDRLILLKGSRGIGLERIKDSL